VKRNTLKRLNRDFSAKILLVFLLFTSFISFAFTAIFIHQQGKALKGTLLKHGTTLSRMLAYNARIGVFSESASMLRDPVAGALQQTGVREVSIFNLKQNPLVTQTKTRGTFTEGGPAGEERWKGHPAFRRIMQSGSPLFLETGDSVEFWSAVFSAFPFDMEEKLYFNGHFSPERSRLIGFTRIVVDKGILEKQHKPGLCGRNAEKLLAIPSNA